METMEEIREAVWQKNKPEEMALIKEIEEAQRILMKLQQKYRDFETRVTQEVEFASKNSKESESTLIKIKVKKAKK